jgi:hypothetical protein
MEQLVLKLHQRVKMCFVLSAYIKHTGDKQIATMVVAKESFTILSKQILALQMHLRLNGHSALLDLDDDSFYLTKYEQLADYYNAIQDLIKDLKIESGISNEYFENNIQDRLDLLLNSLVNSLSKLGVDNL